MVMDRDCGYAKSTKLPGTGTVSPVDYIVVPGCGRESCQGAGVLEVKWVGSIAGKEAVATEQGYPAQQGKAVWWADVWGCENCEEEEVGKSKGGGQTCSWLQNTTRGHRIVGTR